MAISKSARITSKIPFTATERAKVKRWLRSEAKHADKPAAKCVAALLGRLEQLEPNKNAAAVSLGQLGGRKGGPARAAKLSKARRVAIAKKAAAARWHKVRGKK